MTPCRHRVNYYETDKMGITHHANYLHWMEEARVDFLDQLGWSYARLEELGVFSPVTSLECAYRAPTTFGDLVDVTVAVREYRGPGWWWAMRCAGRTEPWCSPARPPTAFWTGRAVCCG